MGWGDELMVAGLAREAQLRDPRKVRVVYDRPRYHEAWKNNPRIALKDEKGDLQELPGRVNGLRPYMTAKDERRYVWKPYTAPVGELYFDEEEMLFGARHAARVIVEPTVKAGAYSNKDWGWRKWTMLARVLAERGIPVTQIGPETGPHLEGVEFIGTGSVRRAAAMLATARAAVVTEGALHHVCAVVGCPAVVIYGGFISPEVTGYAGQAGIFTGQGLGCGRRIACSHCRECMDAITPQRVAEELEALLEKRAGIVAA